MKVIIIIMHLMFTPKLLVKIMGIVSFHFILIYEINETVKGIFTTNLYKRYCSKVEEEEEAAKEAAAKKQQLNKAAAKEAAAREAADKEATKEHFFENCKDNTRRFIQ